MFSFIYFSKYLQAFNLQKNGWLEFGLLASSWPQLLQIKKTPKA